MVRREIDAEFGAVGIGHCPQRGGLILGNANELFADNVLGGNSYCIWNVKGCAGRRQVSDRATVRAAIEFDRRAFEELSLSSSHLKRENV